MCADKSLAQNGATMTELNKRQYEILTFMANTGNHLFGRFGDENYSDFRALIESGLCEEHTEIDQNWGTEIWIAPPARERFRNAVKANYND
jgi:hypothetical protein